MNISEYRKKLGFVKSYSIIVGIIVIFVLMTFEFSSYRHQSLLDENDLLHNSLDNLKQEYELIRSEFNKQKVALDVASLSNEKAQQQIQDLLDKQRELQQQVGFYQRVLAPETTQGGFLVNSVEVSDTSSDNNFEIRFMLLQNEDIKAVIRGTLEVQISGSLNGKPVAYKLQSLQDEPEQSLKFGFKYFQVLSRYITLPEGFTPELITINTDIYKYKRMRGSYTRSISWKDAYSKIE